MTGHLRRSVVGHFVSPYGIAVLPTCLFLFAWLFPPNLYTRYILEPDLMHLDLMVLLFVVACVAAFLGGVRARLRFGAHQRVSTAPRQQSRSGLLYLLAPLTLAGLPCLIYLFLLAGNMNFIALLLSQRGVVLKEAITGGGASGYWGSTLFLLTGVLWWAAYRYGQSPLKGKPKAIFHAAFFLCFAVDVATCLATFDRTNLMPLLAGLTLIYLFFKARAPHAGVVRIAIRGLAALLLTVGAFVALQLARSASRLDTIIASLLGYTIVSFNRLAAMMLGVIHYLYHGKSAYLIAFLTENERFHDIRAQMGLPGSYQIWLSEFPALRAGGLNSAYNWASVFGYLYSDIGWWTPLYFFAAGLIAGHLWERFCAGTTLGIVLYPWTAFSILFWFGWNLLLDARGIVLIETSILLFVYDKLTFMPGGAIQPASLKRSSWEPLRSAISGSDRGLR